MNNKKQKLAPLPELDQISYILPRRYDVSEMARNGESNHSKLMRNESTMILLDDKIAGLEKTQIERFKNEAKKAYRISKTPMKKVNFGGSKRNKSYRNKDANLFNNIFVNPRKDKLVQLKRNTDIKDEETRK